jgi:hypothetical protein
MITTDAKAIFDAYISGLPAEERLALVEMITRSLADPMIDHIGDLPAASLREIPGWQAGEQRGDRSEWRDRML